jgi:hypothetical protein
VPDLAAPAVAPATGKLGVVCVGLGAVTTTFISGVELARRGMAEPIGSLTQMGTIRLGKRTEDRAPLIKDFVPLAGLGGRAICHAVGRFWSGRVNFRHAVRRLVGDAVRHVTSPLRAPANPAVLYRAALTSVRGSTMIKNYFRYTAVAAVFSLASGISNVAFAVLESESPPNDSISTAQALVIGDSGRIEVEGIIGIDTVGTPVPDVDFYSFYGRAGDTVTVNIDDGIKSPERRSLDSLIAIFAPDGTVLRQRNNVGDGEVDFPESISPLDPRIEKVNLPVSGTYTVGVTSDATYPDGTMRVFLTGGSTTPYVPRSTANGSYKLIIEVVAPQLLQISIDIKPRAKKIGRLYEPERETKINPQSKKKIKVALLSSA